MQIFVKTVVVGRGIHLEVESSDTIDKAKEQIQEGYNPKGDAAKVRGIPDLAWLSEGISGARAVALREEQFRMMFIYPCRNGTVINFVGFHPDPHHDDPDWTSTTSREELLEQYKDFHRKFLRIFELEDSEPIIKWQLHALPLLPTWIRGRAAILGDAAHATLPLMDQGVAMAVEEAASLGCLLPLGTTREDVPARLEAYQALRKPRGEYVNTESVEQASVPSKRGRYMRTQEMQNYIFEYDAAQEYFQEHFTLGHSES
ncbi:hypothetical protein C8J57DRAFT_1593086 [Mycena rebaudengoi]|nr:hypothetical protein C8J57DRAFT_1593086 [Mycena rebaudengoi]